MIFVTGTDTGCGKTTVGRGIAAAARRRGLRVGVLKPVETGCAGDGPDGRRPEDALALARAAGLALPVAELCPYRLALPASPERAAEAEGVTIELAAIRTALEAMARRSDLVIVEGAGGLLVPVAPELTTAELARALGLPLVVVARDALGTVNHTLLTVEAARARGLEPLGVVLSAGPTDATDLGNAEAISRHGRVAVLGTLPWLPGADDAALGRAAEAALDLDRLLTCRRA